MAEGRPTKCTPERIDKIAEYLRTGHYAGQAAILSGINPSTYFDWLAKGKEDPNSIWGEFANAVEEATAQAEDIALSEVRAAAAPWKKITKKVTTGGKDGDKVEESISDERGDWQAAAWYLERSRPSRYGRRQVVEHEGEIHVKRHTLNPVGPSYQPKHAQRGAAGLARAEADEKPEERLPPPEGIKE